VAAPGASLEGKHEVAGTSAEDHPVRRSSGGALRSMGRMGGGPANVIEAASPVMKQSLPRNRR